MKTLRQVVIQITQMRGGRHQLSTAPEAHTHTHTNAMLVSDIHAICTVETYFTHHWRRALAYIHSFSDINNFQNRILSIPFDNLHGVFAPHAHIRGFIEYQCFVCQCRMSDEISEGI